MRRIEAAISRVENDIEKIENTIFYLEKIEANEQGHPLVGFYVRLENFMRCLISACRFDDDSSLDRTKEECVEIIKEYGSNKELEPTIVAVKNIMGVINHLNS